MDKTTNFKRIGFFLLKIILLLVVLTLFYLQLSKTKFSLSVIKLEHPLLLFFALTLIAPNWFFEFLKWKSTLKALEVKIKDGDDKSSFYAGIVTGMITPNMLGNFIGRLYYFDRKYRIPITLWTLISNNAQFLVTVLYGVLAMFISTSDHFTMSGSGILILPLITLFFVWFYFQYDKVLNLFSFSKNKLLQRLIAQKKDNKLLGELLVWSLLRYVVFLSQFALVLIAFGAKLDFNGVLVIMEYYFILTFFPSLFLGKFIIRDSVAIMVLGGAVASNEIVLCASFSIWVMNLLLPSLFSLILLKNKKV